MKENRKSRRQFFSPLGKTAVMAGARQPFVAHAHDGAPGTVAPGPIPGGFTPVKLPRLEATSEKTKPPLATPLNCDQQIGFAGVGLGHLSLEEILPAFGVAKFAKLVAPVSGDREKSLKVARQ